MKIEADGGETDWRKLADLAQRIERGGFDSIGLHEIIGDPFIHAAMAANATDRVQVTTAIAVAFPRSPMVVASQAWSIQVNSRGRFALGLGTQVKAHNERRFSTPYGAPRSRLIEYVKALRAIWRCWELGERLKFEGDHYQFTLMTPEFTPPKSNQPMVPVYLAAVRPKMIESAARVADGLRLHLFCTKKYLQEVVHPAIDRGLESAGRSRSELDVCGGGFIATGPDEEAVEKQREWARYRIAFYGSTPSYGTVMALHGWEDLARKLHQMTRAGEWDKMAATVPDEVLDEFVVSATYEQLATAIKQRFGGLSDTVEVNFETGTDPSLATDVVLQVQRIETPFKGHAAHYDEA